MYSKAKVGGHPVHPMLVAFPVASYTGALVGFAVYVANGHQFWLNLAIALSIAGAGSAVLAALPGFVDLTFGVPRRSQVKVVGLARGTESHGSRAVHRRGGHLRGQLGRTTRRGDPRARPVGRGRGGHRRRRGARLDARPDLPRRGPPHGQPSARRGQRPASAGAHDRPSPPSGMNAATTGVRRRGRLGHRLGREAPGARRQARGALRVRLTGFRRAAPAIVGGRLRSRWPVMVRRGRWSRRAALAAVTRRGRRS